MFLRMNHIMCDVTLILKKNKTETKKQLLFYFLVYTILQFTIETGVRIYWCGTALPTKQVSNDGGFDPKYTLVWDPSKHVWQFVIYEKMNILLYLSKFIEIVYLFNIYISGYPSLCVHTCTVHDICVVVKLYNTITPWYLAWRMRVIVDKRSLRCVYFFFLVINYISHFTCV